MHLGKNRGIFESEVKTQISNNVFSLVLTSFGGKERRKEGKKWYSFNYL